MNNKMTIKSLSSKLVAVAFLSFAVVQVHAFVNDPADISIEEDVTAITERIASIADDLDAEEVEPNVAVEEIDLAIDEVDSMLDTEPANEEELLDLRDTLVEMRSEVFGEMNEEELLAAATCSTCQPCATCNSPAPTRSFSSGGFGGFSGGGFGGGGFGGGLGGGGLSFGGGGLGGFLTSPLGLASVAGGIVAIAVSGDDDDADVLLSLIHI